jgi:hypothetical protein
MANRLTHSLAGFVRSLQVSSVSFFGIVEGPTDQHFYARLVDTVCRPRDVSFDILTGHEIPGNEIGKTKLLTLFEYLRRKTLLYQEFKGKRLACAFFVDKDVDDLLRSKRHSSHIVYTEHYDADNYLFLHGDLHGAVAAAAPLPPHFVRTAVGNPQTWRRLKADNWRAWVTLCAFTHLYRVNCPYGYSQTSRVNHNHTGPVDNTAYTEALNALKLQSGMTETNFRSAFARVERHIEKFYNSGQFDSVFKGTWYSFLMSMDLRELAKGRHFTRNGLDARIRSNLDYSVDFTQAWAAYLRGRVETIVQDLG